jgi:hypothetical protein
MSRSKNRNTRRSRNRKRKQEGSLMENKDRVAEEPKTFSKADTEFFKDYFKKAFGWSGEKYDRKYQKRSDQNNEMMSMAMREFDISAEEAAKKTGATPMGIIKDLDAYERDERKTPFTVSRPIPPMPDRRTSEPYTGPRRFKKQEGSLMVPSEIGASPVEEDLPIEEDLEATDVPVDTYPNATPEELEGAQEPDEEMEEGYMEFIISESLVPEEQQYLMQTLEEDPQLSMIFDKVVETASEFSGSGEVQGPGNSISDSIPARLSDGEFVMTQKATEQLGPDNLQILMDEAERAYDGGLMREGRYLGGELRDEELGQGKSTDDDIRKLMSIKANKTPSLR